MNVETADSLKENFREYVLNSHHLPVSQENREDVLRQIDTMSEGEWAEMLSSVNTTLAAKMGDEKAKAFIKFLEGKGEAGELNILMEESNNIYTRLMDREENITILNKINLTSPSDLIRLDTESDRKLCKMWTESAMKQSEDGKVYLPSDLFFAETIPLMDCEIEIDERNNPKLKSILRNVVKFRVVIWEDYYEYLSCTPDGKTCSVGALMINMDDKDSKGKVPQIIMEIKCMAGSPYVLRSNRIGYRGFPTDMMPKIEKLFSGRDVTRGLGQDFFTYMETWYGVQVSLLHPVYKTVYAKPQVEKREKKLNNAKPGKKKRSSKIIRRHVIRLDDFEKTIPDKYKSFNRQTLAWYVVGHFRHYETKEEPTFVKGHWRGPLREVKENIDEGRDRVLDKKRGD